MNQTVAKKLPYNLKSRNKERKVQSRKTDRETTSPDSHSMPTKNSSRRMKLWLQQ